ncbi:MAG: HAMP domain-containing sensor histidine kinase [Sideroxydans sp.]|nr:HAMP domain-containing sensor histidine kinase [Sideroxydans sp.]
MKEALSTLVIHDIKNSLALLEADLEQLNHQPGMPEEARKAYQRCIELKQRLVSFLTLYKHEQFGLKPNLVEIDLLEFLQDTLDVSPSASGKHGHAFALEVDESRIRIAPDAKRRGSAQLDEYLTGMAIESALNNALRYAAGHVWLWFEQETDKVTFCVQDDGPGLDHPAGNAPSTGVGVALCKAVAEAHGGGSVSLTDGPDGGALFKLTLHTA